MYEHAQANWFRRMVRLSGALRPMSWFYARTVHHIDRVVYRLTRGGATFTSWFAGLPVVMLTTTGAKSGRRRTLPVLGVPDDGRLVVIASNYGQYRNPAWYHNLRANPRARIAFEGAEREVVARELTGEERERWYARGIEIYPGWTHYRRRAAHRGIPVIELTPADR
ncbi:MAG: nitroreductase family deazaflavin-dependent oxidoreductase [Gemmatimonadetes bacterium]|nr:nitroreductase family deazaflavin-dependent oxidoreductase [Thermoleophilaceae bacterium]MBD0320891.1 nitroreductase family deazaflavin-dependent oxidoreductase [Gemmatimonadota bacterium]